MLRGSTEASGDQAKEDGLLITYFLNNVLVKVTPGAVPVL